jgi:hypothetical protein
MGDVARRRIGTARFESPVDAHPCGASTFPAPRASSSLPLLGGRRGEYAVGDIARALSLRYRETRRIIAALRALAANSGMPLPRNPRLLHGREVRGPAAIHKASIWDAGEFDAWIDGRTSPPGAGTPRVAPPVRAEMARRAAELAA